MTRALRVRAIETACPSILRAQSASSAITWVGRIAHLGWSRSVVPKKGADGTPAPYLGPWRALLAFGTQVTLRPGRSLQQRQDRNEGP